MNMQDGNVIKGEGQPEATAFWIHRSIFLLPPGAMQDHYLIEYAASHHPLDISFAYLLTWALSCSRMHKLRPNTGAVFHTHQPEITALACLENFECASFLCLAHVGILIRELLGQQV
jgi:hypothetical protein